MAYLNSIFKTLERVAPVSLSDEFCKKYGMYDNSGIIINCGKTVRGAVFSLDFSPAAVDTALTCGFDLIVTHHPAIYGGVSRLDTTCDPLAKLINKCLNSRISVISMHLNFDAAPEGIDFYLMRGLGGTEAKLLAPCPDGGYGRIYGVQPQKFGSFAEHVKKEFSTNNSAFYGDKNKIVSKVASFCGAGCDDKAIAFAEENGADVFVSSDMKHHEICALLNRGINVIHLTHYAAENYGFNKIFHKIKDELDVPSTYVCEDGLL